MTVWSRRLSSAGTAQSLDAPGYLAQTPAARRSALATSSAPSRTAFPRSTNISLSAVAAWCHLSCSAWYAAAASRVHNCCSGEICDLSSSSAALKRADVVWIS
jgi:hypothetical protein